MTDQKKKLNMKDDDGKRRRSWFGTWNNYPEDWTEFFEDCEATYYCAGREVCPTTGTKHIQFWCHWKNAKTRNAVKKLFSSKIHLEPLAGTPEEATIYCKKEGDWIEEGDLPQQGERVDLTEIRDMIDNGATDLEIAETRFPIYMRYYKGFDRYRQLKENELTREMPEVIWLYGASGSGKTRYAFDHHEAGTVFIKSCDNKWWDGYDACLHEAVIIDDMPKFGGFGSGVYPSWNEWKTLCDRYVKRVEVKGGMKNMLAKYIYITTSWNPETFFEDDNKKKELRRRVKEFIRLGEGELEDD